MDERDGEHDGMRRDEALASNTQTHPPAKARTGR